MNPEAADMDEVAQYWLDEAEEALSVLHHLFEKSDYSYALFFGHLAVEKLLKSAYVSQKKEHAPPYSQPASIGPYGRHPIGPGKDRATGIDNII